MREVGEGGRKIMIKGPFPHLRNPNMVAAGGNDKDMVVVETDLWTLLMIPEVE